MQQKSQNLSKLLANAAPSIDDGRSDPFDQACILIDAAQGGLVCLIEAIRADASIDPERLDSAASGCLIQLEMALYLLCESKHNAKID